MKRMRVYVASALGAHPEAHQLMEYIKRGGHTIAYDWTEGIRNNKGPTEGGLSRDAMYELAKQDIEAVQQADMLVLLYRPNMRGAWCEMGAMLGLGRPVILLDDRFALDDEQDPCVFLHHPLVDKQHTNVGVLAMINWHASCLDLETQLKKGVHYEDDAD